ncbi:MAG: HAMP domain-containing protein [Fuerstiella sp.]|nr:HAMP domain-containing protein [Fuerstiella sp.]MCP4509690.1 HAMP domain-containing protein [Fuerstiella sp.]MDG2126709.1 ATP-binding protein [Fuerstiella sp.]
MINYRGLKKLLGETSLERKCRLLFGAALMILITTSFWIYAGRTRALVEAQQVVKAQTLIPQILLRRHYQRYAEQYGKQAASADEDFLIAGGAEADTQPQESRADLTATPGEPATQSPAGPRVAGSSDTDFNTFRDHLASVDEFGLGVKWSLINSHATRDGEAIDAWVKFKNGATQDWRMDDTADGERFLKYYEAVTASDSCLQCHNGKNAATYQSGELVAMATVTLSMASVVDQLNHNRIILVASAIVTTFVAMLVAYLIVRYIIVKPVLHLKDVSDEIARGNLNLRAVINTGDEFEELSHAFNRMLRHMTTVNEELRGVNDSFGAKVDQLAQANMELFSSNALKDEFLATMSHELRTPLNSILGFSDVLANAANLDDRQKRYVDNIRTSGRNLMVQINDLLDLAKIESGQMKLTPGPVNVRELVENQANQIMPLADQKNIDLRVLHAEPALPEVHQDAGKLRQILTNLLSNAVKFTPEGGRVRVTAQLKDEDTFEISVEDTGIGIPMQEQDQIFEKFRQGTTVPGERDHVKREFGGTGLGLSIVRELSRLLGGDVFLESEFGKGSVFLIQLPVEAPPPRQEDNLALDAPAVTSLQRITSVDLMNPDADNSKSGEITASSHDVE